jgi:hypothetical protein
MSEYQQWLATRRTPVTQFVSANRKPVDRTYDVYADGRRVPSAEHAAYIKNVRASSRGPARLAIMKATA